jgi:hypothetical protein
MHSYPCEEEVAWRRCQPVRWVHLLRVSLSPDLREHRLRLGMWAIRKRVNQRVEGQPLLMSSLFSSWA